MGFNQRFPSKHGRGIFVEEVEHPVMDALQTWPQFVNLVSQEIRLWAAQIVTQLGQTLHLNSAFVTGFGRNRSKPLQNRTCSVCFLIEDESDSGHWLPQSLFAYMRTNVKQALLALAENILNKVWGGALLNLRWKSMSAILPHQSILFSKL